MMGLYERVPFEQVIVCCGRQAGLQIYIRPCCSWYCRCGPLWNPLTRTSFNWRAWRSTYHSGLASPGPTWLVITYDFLRNLLAYRPV